MTSQPVTLQTTQVEIANSELKIAAYLAMPAAASSEHPYPGVIVWQEIFGVNDHIRDVTRRIAAAGYVAIAPAIFQRQAPGFEAGYTPADIQVGRHYKGLTQASELLSDAQATIAYLQTLPQVAAGGIGSIGFCFGGHVAYLVATLPEIKATASFYGAGITTMTPGSQPGEGPATVSCTPQITGTLYAFFGTADASIPLEQVEAIEQALQAAKIPHQIFRYPADHGFFCDQRSNYDTAAAQQAWPEVLQLFRANLP